MSDYFDVILQVHKKGNITMSDYFVEELTMRDIFNVIMYCMKMRIAEQVQDEHLWLKKSTDRFSRPLFLNWDCEAALKLYFGP